MNSCECGDDGPVPTFYKETQHIAAKNHICDECKAVIIAGDKYRKAVGKWDGDLITFRTCALCCSLRDYASAHIPCICWAHGCMHDDVYNCLSEYAGQASGLMFGAGRLAVAIRMAKFTTQEQSQ